MRVDLLVWEVAVASAGGRSVVGPETGSWVAVMTRSGVPVGVE